MYMSNSEDPDERQHNAAFHLGLHCLLKPKESSDKEIQFYLKNITCDPSIKMDPPNVTISTRKGNSLVHKELEPKPSLTYQCSDPLKDKPSARKKILLTE